MKNNNMSYHFTTKCNNKSALDIWQFIQNGLSNDVTIKSIKDKLPYTINYVTNGVISFSAPSRNDGEPEVIEYIDFAVVVERLKALEQFNTNTAKESFKGTKVYKKRSPLFALLYSCAVIEKSASK